MRTTRTAGRQQQFRPSWTQWRCIRAVVCAWLWPILALVVVCSGGCRTARQGVQPKSAEPVAVDLSAEAAREGLDSAQSSSTKFELSLEGLVRMLSRRDGVECEDLERGLADPVSSLLEVTRTIEQPPWVPMRAATCVIERHGPESVDVLLNWLSDSTTPGFALLVLQRLDLFEQVIAVKLAKKALEGPHGEAAPEHIRKASNPEVRRVVKDLTAPSQ